MIEVLLFIHVIVGIVALTTGLMIFFVKKGSMLHVSIGSIYKYMMFTIFITGTYVSIVHNNLFLLLVGFFSFYLVLSGVRYNRVRSVAMLTLIDKIIVVFFSTSFLAMILLGIYALYRGANNFGIILLAFSSISIFMIIKDIRFYLMKRSPSDHLFWKKEHIGRMIGSYIAAVTAFTVNNFHIEPIFITWLLPTVVGVPFIVYYAKKYT